MRRVAGHPHRAPGPPGRSILSSEVGLDLLADAGLLLAQLRREGLAEVVVLADPPDLELESARRAAERSLLDPLDRLLARVDLEQPPPGDQLLALGERAVDHARPVAVEADLEALRARRQALAADHHAGLGQLLVVATHRREHLRHRLGGHVHLLALRVVLDDHHVAHLKLLGLLGPFLLLRRTDVREIDA